MSVIEVVIQSWPNHPRRLDYFRETIDAAVANLTASGHELRWWVSAESQAAPDAQWQGAALIDECRRHGLPVRFRGTPPDIGGHLNEIWRVLKADLLFVLQDDWKLLRPLDLSAAVRLLSGHETALGVRYWANTGYLTGPACSRFVPINNAAPWAYGDNPALWHRRFFDNLGPFMEGGLFGSHELAMGDQLRESLLCVWAAAECAENASYWFDHLGTVTSVPNDTRWADKLNGRVMP